MTFMLVPVSVLAKPSVEQIKSLSPDEEYVASPFFKNFDEFAKQQRIVLNRQDITSTFPRISMGLGSVVKVWRAPKYTIDDASTVKKVRSWGTSIGEILADSGIKLGEQDAVTPQASALPPTDAKIAITRVKETEVIETEIVKFDTVEKKDATLERGKTEVVQTGKNGKKEKVYLSRRENGQEVSRQLMSSRVIEEAINKITHIGTKIVVLSSETGESSWTWLSTASRRYGRGTLLRVTNLANGKSVETRVGDWGPEASTGRILDLNHSAWETIAGGGLGSGTMQVRVEELNE